MCTQQGRSASPVSNKMTVLMMVMAMVMLLMIVDGN